jgi:hypothetical protein
VKTSFQDSHSRKYEVVVTLGTAIAIKKQTGVNLSDIGDGSVLDRISNDPELLVGVLWCAVQASAIEHQLTPEQFAASLGGDTLSTAVEALLNAIVLFSPPSARTALRKMVDLSRQTQALAGQRVETALESVTPEMLLTASAGVGNLQESSASATPSPAP